MRDFQKLHPNSKPKEDNRESDYCESQMNIDDDEIFSNANDRTGTCIIYAVAQFLAVILSSGKVSLSAWQSIAANANVLVDIILENISKDLQRLDVIDKTAIENIVNQYKSPCNMLPTKYKLDNFMAREGFLIRPTDIVLDSDIFYHSKNSVPTHKIRPIRMQYVPIKSTLQNTLKIPGMLYSIVNSQKRDGVNIQHYRDGLQFADANKNVILINIYFDEIETGNALGSKSGKHKLAQFYFSIIDMPPHMLGSVSNYFLLACLKSEDFKMLKNANSVMEYIVKELKLLWTEGIDISDIPSSRDLGIEGNRIKIRLAQLVGDNLGMHTILGFSEGLMPIIHVVGVSVNENLVRYLRLNCMLYTVTL